MQRRLNKTQVAELVADYDAGMSIADVTRKYQIGAETVRRWLRANGVTLRLQKIEFSEDCLIEAKTLRDSGWTHRQLGERYGCSHETVRKALAQ